MAGFLRLSWLVLGFIAGFAFSQLERVSEMGLKLESEVCFAADIPDQLVQKAPFQQLSAATGNISLLT
jgi:hypothetical protein